MYTDESKSQRNLPTVTLKKYISVITLSCFRKKASNVWFTSFHNSVQLHPELLITLIRSGLRQAFSFTSMLLEVILVIMFRRNPT